MQQSERDAVGAQCIKRAEDTHTCTEKCIEIEEYFNAQFETIAVALHREGLEYNDDGNLVKFDTPYAMGAKQGGDIIAKPLK